MLQQACGTLGEMCIYINLFKYIWHAPPHHPTLPATLDVTLSPHSTIGGVVEVVTVKQVQKDMSENSMEQWLLQL